MSLKRKTAETIPLALTLVAQGEEVTINIVYHNRKGSEISAKHDEGVTMAELVRYLVKSWDAEFGLTDADLTDLEDAYPGTLLAVMEAYNDARTVARAKN